MTAQTVEAQLFCFTEFVLEKLGRGRRADRVRIIILVECRSQVERLAIQVEMTFAGLDRAEPKPIPELVGDRAFAQQHKPDAV